MGIAVLGDIMIDKTYYGSVKRLNPESPAPLFNIEKEEVKLGGAANVAANVVGLADRVDLIGVLGSTQEGNPDLNGDNLISLCNDNNIVLYHVLNKMPTITKHRFIEKDYNHHLLRADSENVFSLSQDHRLLFLDYLQQSNPKFLIISNYMKGTVDEELMKMIKTYCLSNNIKIIVYTKPSDIGLFKGVYVVRMNLGEFSKIINQDIANEDSIIEKFGKEVVKEYDFNLIVTRGEKGSTLITQEGKFYHLYAEEKPFFDITGAGDTFIAALAVALRKGYKLQDAVVVANKASGITVGKVGTYIVTKAELKI